jgi:hypothetical protein
VRKSIERPDCTGCRSNGPWFDVVLDSRRGRGHRVGDDEWHGYMLAQFVDGGQALEAVSDKIRRGLGKNP